MMITRELKEIVEKKLFHGKVVIVVGARQVGKTTLFREVLRERTEKTLHLNLDESEARELLTNPSLADLQRLLADYEIVVLDEAQRAVDVGLTLKRIHDNFPQVQLLVTGSSALDLRARINEPLTGRKWEYTMYPLSTRELYASRGLLYVKQTLESRLICGSYPDVMNYATEARETLMNLTNSYLYKDLLEIEGIRKPALIEKLLVALALQLGSEVSYSELAQTVGSDSKTIEKYIDLLEKCFIVFRLYAFSRNLRNELKKTRKVYFYDNGVRNAILQNFAPLTLRSDVGALWENFFISERMKYNHYNGNYVKSYFWRTKSQQEIDYIEEGDGRFSLFEMKWNSKKASTAMPQPFLRTYDVAMSSVVTPDNYLDFLL